MLVSHYLNFIECLKFSIIRYLIFEVEVGALLFILFLKRGPFRIPQIKVTLPCLFFFLFLVVLKEFHSVVIEVCEKCLFINVEADLFRLLNLQDFMSCHLW